MKSIRLFAVLLLFMLGASISFAGDIDTLVLHSDVMNRDIEVIVVKPSAPVQPVVKGKKAKTVAPVEQKHYPVVYLLHGAYGNSRSWLEIKPNLPEIADEKGLIFVTPNALNSWYFDSPKMKDFQYETFVTKDLINYIDSHYPTIPSREARAITGLSMGGHGAMFLAIRHKDLFGACGSMSGGLDIRPFPQNWNLPDVLGEMAGNINEWNTHTVATEIEKLQNHDLEIIFDCGESDFFLEVNKDLHKRLLGRGVDHDFTTRPGGHTSEYWNNSLDYHLVFFTKYFKSHQK